MTATPNDREQLRVAVFEEWDPIGVHAAYDDEEDRSTYWDEYDEYLPEIQRRLDDGDEAGLASYLAFVRTNLMGLAPSPQLDAAAAKNLVRRHATDV